MRRKAKPPAHVGACAPYDPTETSGFKPEHIGSDFQDFLAEEGILAEVQASSLKRVTAYLLKTDRANKRD